MIRRKRNYGLMKYRDAAGMTQTDVAKAINVSRTSVSNWENCISSPSFANLKKLAKLYNVSIEELMG